MFNISNKSTPSNKNAVKLSAADLHEKLDIQQKLIESLITSSAEREDAVKKMEARIQKLERDQMMNEALLVMKDRVQSLLSKRITQLEQYTRRYSVIIKGIDKEKNEKYDGLKEKIKTLIGECESSTTFDEVDKFHRNGRREGNEQDVIIRFKSHSAKEAFYKKRKSIQNEKIKIQPSLSPSTKQQLEEAKELITHYQTDALRNPPHFVMADMHGQLLLKMTHETKDGIFFRFESPEQLIAVISKCNSNKSVDAKYDKKMEMKDDMDSSMVDLIAEIHERAQETCGEETLALNLSA